MTDALGRAPIEINSMGKPCPMPLLMLKRALKTAEPHQVFLLKSSDPHSEIDIGRYCAINHLSCELIRHSANEFHYLIES
ncbi:sulfurtransferase TusA family protein [Acinetobacter piscicola]|uniref:sulfurtransferase TusA family protein n=1 Tax=Acinetobacter piscicola TaxID=2006115 RepID=UPI00148BAE28|nr:sulfurtransferase TusA family protein [Acinetobacter piscicola]